MKRKRKEGRVVRQENKDEVRRVFSLICNSLLQWLMAWPLFIDFNKMVHDFHIFWNIFIFSLLFFWPIMFMSTSHDISMCKIISQSRDIIIKIVVDHFIPFDSICDTTYWDLLVFLGTYTPFEVFQLVMSWHSSWLSDSPIWSSYL